MKKIILVTISAFLIMSCGTTTSLYYWGGNKKGTTAYEIPHTRITTSRLLKVCANLYASMKIWSKILEEHARCLLQASVPNTGIYC